MSLIRQLLNIMYNPISYVDNSHLPERVLKNRLYNELAANYWLLSHYKLVEISSDWQAVTPVYSMILKNWDQLNVIAKLTGGHLLRGQLMMQSSVLLSDSRLLSFVSLPLAPQFNLANECTDIHACGVAFLEAIVKSLPVGLQQRLSLCFPKDMVRPAITVSSSPANINLLSMAIDYANYFYK